MASMDILAGELEALQCIYNEEELTVAKDDPLIIKVQLDPEPSQGGLKYVHACLALSTSHHYPEVAAKCSLQDVKGLGDERQARLQERLNNEATEMSGDMMLGHLCSTAQEQLTEMNCPEGTCAFCLEELEEGKQAEGLLVLSCYHCFHRVCFARWYIAMQRAKRKEREQAIRAHTHAATPEFLEKAGLATLDYDLFAVACPICRTTIHPAEFASSDLRHFSAMSGIEVDVDRSIGMTGEALDLLRQTQVRHKVLYARQLAVSHWEEHLSRLHSSD